VKQSRCISGFGLSLLICSLALSGPAFEVSSYAQSTQKEVSPKFTAAAAYKKRCSACHDHGIMGAPKPGHQRFSQDIDTLVTNAITGIGKMPARGHAAFLSDAEMRSIVEYMVLPQE
jgi:cytochrome c5